MIYFITKCSMSKKPTAQQTSTSSAKESQKGPILKSTGMSILLFLGKDKVKYYDVIFTDCMSEKVNLPPHLWCRNPHLPQIYAFIPHHEVSAFQNRGNPLTPP